MEIVKIKSTTKDDDMSMDTSMGENSLTSYSTTLTNITIASIAATKDSDDSMYMIDGKLRIRGHAVRQMSNRCIGSTELKNIMEKGTKGKENDKETFVLNNIKVYYDPEKDVIDTIYFIFLRGKNPLQVLATGKSTIFKFCNVIMDMSMYYIVNNFFFLFFVTILTAVNIHIIFPSVGFYHCPFVCLFSHKPIQVHLMA